MVTDGCETQDYDFTARLCRKKLDSEGRTIIFKISAAVPGKHTQSLRNGTVLFLKNRLCLFSKTLKVDLPLTNTFIIDNLHMFFSLNQYL